MTTFLIFYSDVYDAKVRCWPLQGSVLEISTLEDLDAFSDRLNGSKLILRNRNHQIFPYWTYYHNEDDYEANKAQYCVNVLPLDWEKMRWIEVYNGYR